MAQVHSSGAYNPPAMDAAMDTRLSSRPRGSRPPHALTAIAGCDPPGVTDSCDTSSHAVRDKGAVALSSGVHYVKRVSESTLRRRRYRREAVKRLGGKCARCGTTEALEFDHIDPFTRHSQDDDPFESRRRMEAELPLLQLLCNTCHIEKSRYDNFLKVGHPLHARCGTTTGYFSRGCRCEECTDAMRAYHRKRKAS